MAPHTKIVISSTLMKSGSVAPVLDSGPDSGSNIVCVNDQNKFKADGLIPDFLWITPSPIYLAHCSQLSPISSMVFRISHNCTLETFPLLEIVIFGKKRKIRIIIMSSNKKFL